MTIGCGCLLCYERSKMNLDQIAAEAADEFIRHWGFGYHRDEAIAIIKAACEKAVTGVWHQGYKSGLEAKEERAAQASYEPPDGEGYRDQE